MNNLKPITNNVSVQSYVNQTIRILLEGTNPELNPLIYQVSNVQNGTYTLIDNIVNFTPLNNFVGITTFNYKAIDNVTNEELMEVIGAMFLSMSKHSNDVKSKINELNNRIDYIEENILKSLQNVPVFNVISEMEDDEPDD